MTIVEKDINAMIRFQYRREIRIVPAGIYDVRLPILIEISQLKIRRPIRRRETQHIPLTEPTLPLIRKKKDPLIPLRKQSPDIRQPVVIIVIHISLYRTRRRPDNMPLIPAIPLILQP